VVLGPGEVLFVPANTPHYVENLDDDPSAAWTCAYGGNFVDDSNLDAVLSDLRLLDGRGDEDGVEGDMPGSTASELNRVDFDEEQGMVEEHLTAAALCVPYEVFAGGDLASWVPSTKNLAEEEEEEESDGDGSDGDGSGEDDKDEMKVATEEERHEASFSLREQMEEDGFVVLKGAIEISAALKLRESVLTKLAQAQVDPTPDCFSKVHATLNDSIASETAHVFLAVGSNRKAVKLLTLLSDQ
jgi:mannose-6-phosphate isomerase-like protein (cupin superfamily)